MHFCFNILICHVGTFCSLVLGIAVIEVATLCMYCSMERFLLALSKVISQLYLTAEYNMKIGLEIRDTNSELES